MKITVPFGKVLASGIVTSGVYFSNLAAKSIKKTEKPGLKSEVAQSTAITGITATYMAAAALLWNSKALNPTIGKGKHEDEDMEDRWDRKVTKWITQLNKGKIEYWQFEDKVCSLYSTECFDISKLTRAAFVYACMCDGGKAWEAIKTNGFLRQRILQVTSCGYDEQQLQEVEAAAAELVCNILNIQNSDNDDLLDAVCHAVQEAAPEVSFASLNEKVKKIIDLVNARAEDSPYGDYDPDDAETLDDLIALYSEPQTPNVGSTTETKRSLTRDEILAGATNEKMAKLTREEIVRLLADAVLWFGVQEVSAVTVSHLLGIAQEVNPEAVKMFQERYSHLATQAKNIRDDVVGSGDAVDPDRLAHVGAMADASSKFCEEIQEFRDNIDKMVDPATELMNIVKKAMDTNLVSTELIVTQQIACIKLIEAKLHGGTGTHQRTTADLLLHEVVKAFERLIDNYMAGEVEQLPSIAELEAHKESVLKHHLPGAVHEVPEEMFKEASDKMDEIIATYKAWVEAKED